MATSTLTNLIGSSGYVTVAWTNAEQPANFYSWRLYYRQATEDLWKRVYENTSAQASYSVNVYAWAVRGTQEIVLVSVTQDPSSGVLAESAKTGANSFTYTGPAKYWLVHPTDPTKTVQLEITTSEDITEEVDAKVMNLLDVNGEGGKRKVSIGGSFGTQGSMSATIYDHATLGTAREQRLKILALQRAGTEVFLRDPFGGMTPVFIISTRFSRIAGLGESEGVETTIAYVELDSGGS